jgi:probable rRNA maturation factor
MLELDIVGRAPLAEAEIERLAAIAAASAGVNREYRAKDAPTDVLSFPIDGAAADPLGPRELGDVVICPEHTVELREAVVHGVLHLLGMDHERDEGEMLALQRELLSW